ncbi:MAG TPA: transcription elongation factor GreB [Polyangia bacterium]|nr:transcription elongation factor GreB [Polyangia bacterium]
MAEKNYITPDGYKRLVDELTELATVERPKVVREVSDAAAEGDRSENAAYIYGKRRLREIDRRMGFLQRRLEHMQVVKAEEQQKDRVRFGAFVTIEDEQGEERVYQIVGVDEVDAKRGKISWKSPVGRALLGKQVDDEVKVRWDAGERELVIVDIRYESTDAEAPKAEAPKVEAAKAHAPKAKPTAKPKAKPKAKRT